MDYATAIGLVTGLILIVAAIATEASPLTFVSPASVLIVIGGTMAAIFVAFPFDMVRKVIHVAINAFRHETGDPDALIRDLVKYAEIARRDGILALEDAVDDMSDDFMVKGIQLAVDGTDPELIYQTMSTELEYISDRHKRGRDIFKAMGKYAPAFGMIGTLIGLILMLQQLDDPTKLGPAMALALITTFYGAVAANLVFLPMADKLQLRSKQEMLLKEIVIRGVMSIQSGDNPKIVEQKLRIFLPPEGQVEG